MTEVTATPNGFLHVPGPLHVEVCNFGQGQGGTFDGLLVFGAADPDLLPGDVRAALAGHVQAGRRIVVMTHTESGMAWVRAQIAVLTAPGGHA
jgi:hypothetical protein